MISVTAPNSGTYFVACNPLTSIFHHGFIQNGSQVGSGQPFMLHKENKDELYSMVFSAYYDNSQDNEIPLEDDIPENVPHSFVWSVYDDESEIDGVISLVNSIDFLIVNKIKHPNEEKWAIPLNDHVFNSIPDGDTKTQLYEKSVQSVVEGRRFSTQSMIEQGWV